MTDSWSGQPPQYGSSQYGNPRYGNPRYGNPQHSSSQHGQQQYGEQYPPQPVYGQPPAYGRQSGPQQSYGQPYGQPPTPSGEAPQYGQPPWATQPPGDALPGGVEGSVDRRARAAAVKQMVIGGVVLAIGVIITVATYSAASDSGGTYVVAYGPAIAGLIYFVRGLVSYLRT